MGIMFAKCNYSDDTFPHNSGPSIDACGTPVVITRLSDTMSSISIYCCMFVK